MVMKMNKFCQKFITVAEKIRATAKTVEGKIYLDQVARKYLTDWMESNEEEIVNCFRCRKRIKKWMEENFVVSSSDFLKEGIKNK